MKTRLAFLLIALLTWAQGVWATDVTTESELRSAIADGANIKLTADIALSNYLGIDNGKTVTLDLNGHTVSRNSNSYSDLGSVIRVEKGGTLTVKDSSGDNSGKKMCQQWANTLPKEAHAKMISTRDASQLIASKDELERLLGIKLGSFWENLFG